MQVDYSEQLPIALKDSAVRLYLDAFRDKLGPILGRDGKALDVLQQNLDPAHCIAAVIDQRLVGILAVKSSKGSFLNPSLKTMVPAYGIPGGILRMLGLALLDHSTAPGEFYVDGIAVVKELRGKGIGTCLLGLLERTALKKKMHSISLEVIDTNPKAEALYKRLGFKRTKKRNVWPLNCFIQFSFKSTWLMVKKIK